MSKDKSFQCPDGFERETPSSQLYYEDLDNDSEIWLIRMPNDINTSSIDNQEVVLDGNLHNLNPNSSNTQYEYISDATEITNLSLVLPEKSSGKLRCKKQVIKGSIFFNEDLVMNDMGSKVKMEVDTNNIANNSSLESSKLLTSLDRSLTLNTETLTPAKKQSKKKSKSLPLERIKKEFASDSDDFPVCKSQIC